MDPRRFANAVLVAAALTAASGAALAARVREMYDGRTHHGLLPIAALAVLAAAFLASLRLTVNVRTKVALVALSLAVAAYAAEFCLKDLPGLRLRWMAGRLGVPYDARTQLEVVRDLRRRGVDAWPSVVSGFMGSRAGSEIAPLGGISGVTAVACNELGNYLIYQSDARGFHNPPGLWSGGPLDIAALGDSYTEGRCVHSDQNMVALIRRRYPATLNLGVSGNGPLRELAGLREYLPALRPRRILWFYFEGNDLYDLDQESPDPVLARYLDSGFSQRLLFRQSEIDGLLRRRLDTEYRNAEATARTNRSLDRWRGVPVLRSLRDLLGLAIRQPSIDMFGPNHERNYDMFLRILVEAYKTADTWGGRLHLVYLPMRLRYERSHVRRINDEVRVKISADLRDLEIPLIDLVDVFGRQPNSTELYTPVGGHFTPAGYALVADSVVRALDRTSPGGIP